MIILDTNVVSELFRPAPSPQVEAWLSAQWDTSIFFTTIGEAELRFGVASLPDGRRRDDLADAIDTVMAGIFQNRVLPFDQVAARTYAVIAANRKVLGRPISRFDCQIAAIARAHEATVATRNTLDFQQCGIGLVNPWHFPS